MATKVSSSQITSVSASQITAAGATAGQVLTYNGSTSTWVASAALPTGATGQVLTYNGSTSTWVASAAPSSVVDFTGASQALSANGYQKFPGGLIVQWGTYTVPTANSQPVITFPITFPSLCGHVNAMLVTSTQSWGLTVVTSTASTGTFTTGGGFAAGSVLKWFAIGY